MAIQKINIDDFILLHSYLLVDVRSPGEYEHAHIPGAHPLPLFNNEERALVGTTYKQQSREAAIKIGLPFFGNKMLALVETVQQYIKEQKNETDISSPTIVVHCWRGGMRSAAVAWLLDLYGYRVLQLTGGYKSYRNWVQQQFLIPYSIKVVGGYTGSGKTETLLELKKKNNAIIDLEGLAKHKGSAFGAIGQPAQPSQEMFENLLAQELLKEASLEKTLWVEDESQRIGTVMVPPTFFKQMRNSVCYFLTIPFEDRLNFILSGYGGFNKQDLLDATLRIQKRLGGLETKNAVQFLIEDNRRAAFAILLAYYDKWYVKNSSPSTPPKFSIVPVVSATVDPTVNSKLLEEL